jgi:4-hydroxybenzoate polyprenyl transferase
MTSIVLNYSRQMFFKLKAYKRLLAQSPYYKLMRLDKPVGIYLVLFPCLWTILFAATELWQVFVYVPLFALGAIIMRGAGCTINDIIDQKADQSVERTKHRPLASGDVDIKSASKFLILLLALAFILLLAIPDSAKAVAVLSLIPIACYPYMKYITNFSQVFLGLVFNLGVIIAWLTVSDTFSFIPIIIYLAAAFWTIGYDTIYAHQDRKDDINSGLKSLAIKLGGKTSSVVWHLYLTAMGLLCLVGLNLHMNFIFFGGLAVATYHMYWQIATLDIEDPKNCHERFISNTEVGAILFIAILLGRLRIF